MKLAFSIAKRFLLSGKAQTLIIILGIAVGVSVQVFIGSLISGLQKSLVDKTIGSASQITIKATEDAGYITDYEQKIAVIQQADNNIESVTPTISVNGSLVKSTDNEPILLRGLQFPSADSIYGLSGRLTENSELPDQPQELLLGIGLKEALDLEIGDTISFESPTINSTDYVVVGFFDFNVAAINNTWSVTTIPSVQALLGIGDEVSQIETQVEDVFAAETTDENIMAALDDSSLTSENWIENNAELLSGLQGQSISSLMIQIFVMISVVLGISSVLAITVMQKSKQIGILKAMGIQDADASLVFLFEGLILGLFGAIGGVLLGLGLSYSFTTFALDASGNPVVPLFIDGPFIAISALIALLAATLAALIPARKSSRLSVIEVIRNA
ncbi:MAG: ABC transporter permease [Bacilli bacterium]|nr:ABC transporter permease [Bacilli bacterium]